MLPRRVALPSLKPPPDALPRRLSGPPPKTPDTPMEWERQMKSETRYCTSCAHILNGDVMSESRCRKAKACGGLRFVDPKYDEPALCATVRFDALQCGPSAKWFEPKTDPLTIDDSPNLPVSEHCDDGIVYRVPETQPAAAE